MDTITTTTTTTGDEDLQLRRASVHLITDLQSSLTRFLYKNIPATAPNQSSTASSTTVRRLVRETKTDQLIKLLEPFQEWPQLLDPHLSGLLQPLVSAFIDYMCNHAAVYHQVGDISSGIIPLPRAISKILYVFCKVRGTKVISQFLNNEPRYLEPMLDAWESWAGKICSIPKGNPPKHGYMVWQESFVMLLWLSHLLLAPFDLSSMSSNNPGIQLPDPQVYVEIPATIPPIAKRLVHMSTHHLGLPSKSREAAGTLLVRLAVRTDIRRVGLQKILIDWALSSLCESSDAASPTSIYSFLGILSFLAGFITSAENEVLKPLLSRAYNSVQHAKANSSPSSAMVNSSASARKLFIKVERALAVAGMKIDSKAPSDSGPSLGEGALEDIIDHFLTALEDKDTPVRLAASKGLSVIARELEPDMVEQIIDMIDERLYEDTSWDDPPGRPGVPGSFDLNLGGVSALRWHGLILALSQLIFRGSKPPSSVLGKVMSSLIIALRFEQRSSLGNSIGTSVRDAACFGLWALARRYSTADIKSCEPFRDECYDGAIGPISPASRNEMDSTGITGLSLITNEDHDVARASTLEVAAQPHSTTQTIGSGFAKDDLSMLQVLANQLILAATLDAAGNIRRGASAALQEMIGRHPGEIRHGIGLVQIVDYHGIALRSRAMTEIAINVSRVDSIYWHSVLRGLLDWRGVRSGDADCRRNAAHAIGLLARSQDPELVASTISALRRRLHACESRKVEERHGLILALSEIVCPWYDVEHSDRPHLLVITEGELAKLWLISGGYSGPRIRSNKGPIVTDTKHLHSALTCEAVCSFVAALADYSFHSNLRHPSPAELQEHLGLLEISLRQSDEMVFTASTKAAKALFRILGPDLQENLATQWAQKVSDTSSLSRESDVVGVTAALGAIFQHVQAPRLQDLIIDTLVNLVCSKYDIGLRCTALRSLTSGVLELNITCEKTSKAIRACLDDYTTNRRGDIGSLIRLEAIEATAVVLKGGLLCMRERQDLVARICGLAAEKLDKIRFRAWICLQDNWGVLGLGNKPWTLIFDISRTSTVEYFLQLLSLCSQPLTQDWIRKALLEGYITSAGAGSESLLGASRAAFTSYTESLDPSTLAILCTYLIDLVRDNIANDRIAVPSLEFIAFLFEAGVLQRLQGEVFTWRRLFTEVRKAHFKSGNFQKIEAAVRIYAGMMAVPRVKVDAQEKLTSMLLHPYPKIRNVAADALLIATNDEGLMAVNWSKPQAELKAVVRSFQARIELGPIVS